MIAAVFAVLRVVPVWAWAVAAALGWGGIQYHRAKTQTEARAAAEQAAAVQATAAMEQAKARLREAALNESTRKAADEYRSKLAAANRGAAATRSDRERLLNVVATAPSACPSGTSASSASGVNATTAALRVVVRECTQALSEMAEAAGTESARLSGLQGYVRAIQSGASAPNPP